MTRQNLKHTYRHFADLQLSAQEFYAKLEETIAGYEYPNVSVTRKYLETSGWFNHRREYLCIGYGHYRFYVCASPFGRSYFISWWFQYRRNWFLDWVFGSQLLSYLFEDKKLTLFREDTRLMFENSINSIVSELSATVQPEHGMRRIAPLTSAEQLQ